MNAKEYQKWDTHHHFVADFYVQEMEKLGLTRVGSFPFPKWSPEASLRMMEQSNIAKAFLSMSGPGVYFRDNAFSRGFARKLNDHLANIVHAQPEKFGGFASVPLPDVEGSLKEAVYALDTLKLDGLILMSNVNDHYLGNNNYREFFAELNRRRTVVFVHPNILTRTQEHQLLEALYLWQNDTVRTLLHFIRSGYHREFPHVKFILSHAGGPLPVLYRLLIERLKPDQPDIEAELETWKSQLFLDTASKGFDEQPPAILGFTDTNHIVYGSDYPWANALAGRTIANQFASLESKQGIAQAELQNIFMGNAQKVFATKEPIPNTALPTLTKPYQMLQTAPTNNVNYHYHCLPVQVVETLRTRTAADDLAAMPTWDSHTTRDWMATHHIEKVMLSLDMPCIWSLNSDDIAAILRTYNDAVANIRAGDPKAFGAFGAINIDHRFNAVSEIDYCVDTLKLDGICLYTDINSMALEQFLLTPILEKLASIRVPIMLHPKDTTGIPILNENYLDTLYFMAKALYLGIYDKYFTNTRFVLTHTGGLVPYLAQPLNVLSYLQLKTKKIFPFLIDTYIKKQGKGYAMFMNSIVD